VRSVLRSGWFWTVLSALAIILAREAIRTRGLDRRDGPPLPAVGQPTGARASAAQRDGAPKHIGGGIPPSGNDGGGTETAMGADEPGARTRLVRLRGRIIMGEPSSRAANGAPPAPVNPMSLGIGEDRVLASLTVTSVETGTTAVSNESGRFVLEAEMPTSARRMTLELASNLLMRPDGRTRMVVRLVPGSATSEVDVDLPMIAAASAQPRLNGRVIKPEDLQDPEVRSEFLRQMSEVANIVMPPPPPQGVQAERPSPPPSDGLQKRPEFDRP